METPMKDYLELRTRTKLSRCAERCAQVNPFAEYFGADSVFATGVDGVDFHIDVDISQNGDDAIELFYGGRTVDLYGDIDTDGTGQPWEYTDAFAYRADTVTAPTTTFDLAEWTVAAPDCSDASNNNCDSSCGPYPDPSFTCPLAKVSPPALLIKGVLDLQTPQRSTSGKGIQLLAVEDVPDLSLFGLGVANNGGAPAPRVPH
jgi:hypothetical protein